MTRPIHAIRSDAPGRDHRLSGGCPCQPVEHFDLAEPARIVYVHRTTDPVRVPTPGGASRVMHRRPPR
jgi:hypothetical protein